MKTDKPSVSIEAAADGLRWKVVQDGETIGTGSADTMQEAKAAADEIVARVETKPIAAP
jgi:hypothetical protein